MGGTTLSPPVEASLIPSEVTLIVIDDLKLGVEASGLSSSEWSFEELGVLNLLSWIGLGPVVWVEQYQVL